MNTQHRTPCTRSHEHTAEVLNSIDYRGVQAFPYRALGYAETALLLGNCACGTTLAVPIDCVLHDEGGLR